MVAEGKPSLHFEHTILLREEHINWLLVNKGFEIVTMRHFGGKHSIFYVTRAVEQLLPKTVPPNFYAENRRVFQLWQDRLFEDVSFFKRRLAEDKKRKPTGDIEASQKHIKVETTAKPAKGTGKGKGGKGK